MHAHTLWRVLATSAFAVAATSALAQTEIKFGHVGEPGSLFAASAEEFAKKANAKLGTKAKVVVSELVPAVVSWARGPMAEVFGDSLDDARVNIREIDVGEIIRAQRSAFDAILLDVDNGPEGLTRKGNDALYSAGGLSAAKTALRPGGVLAVWSSGPNAAFTKRLRTAGFDVNEVNVRATGRGGGARHVIWIARKS